MAGLETLKTALLEPLNIFRGQRVVVTGDTGFKGSWLAFWLTELGAEVLGIALPAASAQCHFNLLRLDNRIRHIDVDLRSAVGLTQAVSEFAPAFLFHLAAQPLVRASYLDPKTNFDTNIGGAVNILEAVRATPTLRSVVFVTSDKCYRNKEWVWGYKETDELGGCDPYSASKAAAEIVLTSYVESFFRKRSDLGIASVRAGNVIGGGDWSKDRIIPDCITALMANRPIKLRSPQSTRPWQHVLDPLFGYLLIAERLYNSPEQFSSAWNFGPAAGSVHTVHSVAAALVEHWGEGQIEIEVNPNQPHEARLLHLAIDKARELLGWSPRWDFARSVKETANWYRRMANGDDIVSLTRSQIAAFMEL